MPYVDRDSRVKLDDDIESLESKIDSFGELNYVITRLCKMLRYDMGAISYEQLNSMIGVLECAKLEYYRKDVVPYEDVKESENGPVSV